MAIYVDELVVWPHARGRFKAGSCHLMIRRSLERQAG